MKWLGGNVFVDYRKITCDSDEFNDAVITIKNNVLSKNNMPKLIVGTGLSASYGIPGMWKLSEELKSKLGVHKDDEIKQAWIRREKDINDNGLEEGLKTLSSDEQKLIDEIRKVTADYILREEWPRLLDIYQKSSGFEKLLTYLKATVSVNHGLIDIMTPNYDRVIETLCDKCGIQVITGFSGEIFQRFEPLRLKKPSDYYEGHNCCIRLFKPHGSINWISNGNGEILINDFDYLSKHSEDIEIIAPGSSKYEAGMTNNTFRIMREDFNELISEMNKPYSLLIYGYGFNDTHFNTVLFQNTKKNVLILSKDIKEEVLEKAKNNHMVTALFHKDSTDFMIYKGEQIEIDKSLWNMDVFADVFLG